MNDNELIEQFQNVTITALNLADKIYETRDQNCNEKLDEAYDCYDEFDAEVTKFETRFLVEYE